MFYQWERGRFIFPLILIEVIQICPFCFWNVSHIYLRYIIKLKHSEWEKTIANETTERGLIANIYKQLIQLNIRKTNSPIKKCAENLNKHFSKEGIHMPNKHMKICSTSLIIREIKIKTTMRYQVILVRMAIIKKSSNNNCWRGCEVKATSYILGGNVNWYSHYRERYAAAAAKLLQSCLTLCDPIDGSPPGSPVPRILQARTLEWVAISFSNAWKWKVKVKLLSRARLLATPWTAAYQAPPSMGLSRQEYWSGVPLPCPENCIEEP